MKLPILGAIICFVPQTNLFTVSSPNRPVVTLTRGEVKRIVGKAFESHPIATVCTIKHELEGTKPGVGEKCVTIDMPEHKVKTPEPDLGVALAFLTCIGLGVYYFKYSKGGKNDRIN